MTPGDLSYLQHIANEGLLRSPVIEIGARSWQEEGNASRLCDRLGLRWQGADIDPDNEDTLQLDILDDNQVGELGATWPTVLLFNILEHVYDPISALRNAMRLVSPGGVCIIVSPAVWQIHDFPADYWRPMPDVYLHFADVEGHEILGGTAHWIVGSHLVAIDAMREGSQKLLPSKQFEFPYINRFHSLYSRVLHRTFNTTGRNYFFPYSAFGVVIQKRKN